MSPSGKWLGNPVAVMHAKLNGSPITALVQLSNPHYDATKHQLLGERTSKRYRLGDPIAVKLVKVDLETAKIDFVLDESAKTRR